MMASFDFEGKPITVIAQHAIELGDLDYMKEHFGIGGLVALEDGMGEMEPEAWRAILVASIRRTQPDIDPKHKAVDAVPILPLIEELNSERAEFLAEREKAEQAKAGRARPTRKRARVGTPSSA